jgi:hypothetical protein
MTVYHKEKEAEGWRDSICAESPGFDPQHWKKKEKDQKKI